MKHLLAMALEPEMTRLNDSRMDRPHRHLVNLLALHAIEVGHTDHRPLSVHPPPGIMTRPVRRNEPDRLEPGVPFRPQPELFGNLALKQMDLRTFRRK